MLFDLLTTAREHHFLGPGDVGAHIAHSLAFAAMVLAPPCRAVDLGSGAGVPGLVLALSWPQTRWLLLDANERRSAFLRQAVTSLDLQGRVEVVTERAEFVGRDPAWRGTADVVVARAFGPPAVTAECATPLLRLGGALVVAEPPGGAPARWPSDGLRLLGLVADGRLIEPVALQRFRLETPCPDRFPRRLGVPAKRPLF